MEEIPRTVPRRGPGLVSREGRVDDLAERAARATPAGVARTVRGLSDRAIAWLFVTPTMLLLLGINLFPLVWTVRLSFHGGMTLPCTPSETCQNHWSSGIVRNGSTLKLAGVTISVPPYVPKPLPAHP